MDEAPADEGGPVAPRSAQAPAAGALDGAAAAAMPDAPGPAGAPQLRFGRARVARMVEALRPRPLGPRDVLASTVPVVEAHGEAIGALSERALELQGAHAALEARVGAAEAAAAAAAAASAQPLAPAAGAEAVVEAVAELEQRVRALEAAGVASARQRELERKVAELERRLVGAEAGACVLQRVADDLGYEAVPAAGPCGSGELGGGELSGGELGSKLAGSCSHGDRGGGDGGGLACACEGGAGGDGGAEADEADDSQECGAAAAASPVETVGTEPRSRTLQRISAQLSDAARERGALVAANAALSAELAAVRVALAASQASSSAAEVELARRVDEAAAAAAEATRAGGAGLAELSQAAQAVATAQAAAGAACAGLEQLHAFAAGLRGDVDDLQRRVGQTAVVLHADRALAHAVEQAQEQVGALQRRLSDALQAAPAEAAPPAPAPAPNPTPAPAPAPVPAPAPPLAMAPRARSPAASKHPARPSTVPCAAGRQRSVTGAPQPPGAAPWRPPAAPAAAAEASAPDAAAAEVLLFRVPHNHDLIPITRATSIAPAYCCPSPRAGPASPPPRSARGAWPCAARPAAER